MWSSDWNLSKFAKRRRHICKSLLQSIMLIHLFETLFCTMKWILSKIQRPGIDHSVFCKHIWTHISRGWNLTTSSCCSEDGGSWFLWNISTHLANYTSLLLKDHNLYTHLSGKVKFCVLNQVPSLTLFTLSSGFKCVIYQLFSSRMEKYLFRNGRWTYVICSQKWICICKKCHWDIHNQQS
jgi:hypothetical protein